MATVRKESTPRPATNGSGQGMGVDRQGNPVIDPTANVKALTEAANQRQDDLRDLTKELFDAKTSHVLSISRLETKATRLLSDVQNRHTREIGDMQAAHAKELSTKESSRVDSIRSVDREEVAKTAAAANQAITTLANQTATLAETLRTQVGTVAAAAESRQAAFSQDVNKRLSALELSSSEGKGKQAVVDPQIDRSISDLVAEVRLLRTNTTLTTGQTEGSGKTWGLVAVIVALIISAVGVYISKSGSGTPATTTPPIYVPVPMAAPPTTVK